MLEPNVHKISLEQGRAIRVMLVDDESLAREGLKIHLKDIEYIDIVGECASAIDAIGQMDSCRPDVIFLDIEMPGMSGTEFAQWLMQSSYKDCAIVFVTAFKEFAVEAFDFKALDYLLKPFAGDRFEACLQKIRSAFDLREKSQQHEALNDLILRKTGSSVDIFMHKLAQAQPGNLNASHDTISLKSGTQWLRIKLESILWIEAAGDYMCVHTEGGNHIIRKPLKEFEKELCVKQFMRASRSAIINLTKLTSLTPNSNGEYLALLSSGDSVKVSRKYKLQLKELGANG
jgi:two-component system LytT family response regulator